MIYQEMDINWCHILDTMYEEVTKFHSPLKGCAIEWYLSCMQYMRKYLLKATLSYLVNRLCLLSTL